MLKSGLYAHEWFKVSDLELTLEPKGRGKPKKTELQIGDELRLDQDGGTVSFFLLRGKNLLFFSCTLSDVENVENIMKTLNGEIKVQGVAYLNFKPPEEKGKWPHVDEITKMIFEKLFPDIEVECKDSSIMYGNPRRTVTNIRGKKKK